MDTRFVIIILAIILFILIALNNIKISISSMNIVDTVKKANCSQTLFGCCPDGVNSRINFHGTNCPSFRTPPGYLPTN
jgi:hypothetical protein